MAMRQRRGFSLLELTVSVSILTVVSLLSFIVVRASAASSALATAKEQAQQCVRGVMDEMTREIATASRLNNTALTPKLTALTLNSATSITFQVPTDTSGTLYSTPVTYQFENEDTTINARLDAGEDKNGDGLLTRRIMRTQDGKTWILGGANDVASLTFALNPPANDTVTVTVTATKAVNNRRHDLVTATASTSVNLVN